MTPNAQLAADAIRNFAAKFQGLIEVAALFDQLGSLENAINEAQGRLKQAQVDDAVAQTQLADVKKQLDATTELMANALEDGQKAAAVLVENAKAEAAAKLKQANEAAGKLLEEAQQLTDSEIRERNAKLDIVNQQITARDDELAQLNDTIASRQCELEVIETRIAAARDQIQKMLG